MFKKIIQNNGYTITVGYTVQITLTNQCLKCHL